MGFNQRVGEAKTSVRVIESGSANSDAGGFFKNRIGSVNCR